MGEIRTYYLQNYKISDDKNDKIIAREEVKIKAPKGDFRKLTFDEWAKFVEEKSLYDKYHFLLISKEKLKGQVIIDILDKAPYMLNKIAEEMGGVGYVTLELEEYLFPIDSVKINQAKSRLKEWEKEFDDFYTKLQFLSFENKLRIMLNYLFHTDAAGSIYDLLPEEDKKSIPFDKKKFYEDLNDEKKFEECMQKLCSISDKVIMYLKKNPRLFEALLDSIAIGLFLFEIKKVEYSLEKQLTDGLLNLQTDCDKYAALYVHFAQKKNWNINIFLLNNHTTVAFNNPLFPNGRIFIESTDGKIVDIDLYKQRLQIACLHLGFPDSSFIKSPEKVVVSTIIQKINDLLEKVEGQENAAGEDKKNLERYMLLANKLAPNDPSLLVLSQMVFSALGDRKKAEEYRQKLIHLSK